MKAGPKAAVSADPLPFHPLSLLPSERFAAFCDEFIVTPKGTGAREPMRLRPWQLELVASVFDASPRPRTAGWMMPRGQGKSTLVAALGLYDLMLGEEGASVVVAAVDERQAGIIFKTATRMVELHPELAARVQTYKDRLVVPERGASFVCLPAEPKRLEGLDYTLGLLDEIGVVSRDTYEVLTLAQGKRAQSTLIGIGTPGPNPDSVLTDLREYAGTHPEDTSFVWREHSAAAFGDHPVDCTHCWELANPALDDFLHRDALQALLPPKTREATFRRARLCQFASDTDGMFLPAGCWDGLNIETTIPDGTEVVVALDGSFSDDTTALLLGTVAPEPHFDVLAVWENDGTEGYRVPVAEVEQTIRDACRRWSVVEIVADPFRWTRTLQALEAERLPVVEFPHSPSRLTAATTDLYSAAVNGRMSHSGDPRLAAHVAAAVISEDARGMRLAKASRSRHARKIDLAACLVMAHSRATWRATRRTRRKTRSFK
ncbi:terminase [Nocardioides sp. BGMRC 2183]|nr:terminase [Nocardioides sp. BGMRC 2183]